MPVRVSFEREEGHETVTPQPLLEVGLGAPAGEAKLREAIAAGGFRSVRRATETPFDVILEARP